MKQKSWERAQTADPHKHLLSSARILSDALYSMHFSWLPNPILRFVFRTYQWSFGWFMLNQILSVRRKWTNVFDTFSNISLRKNLCITMLRDEKWLFFGNVCIWLYSFATEIFHSPLTCYSRSFYYASVVEIVLSQLYLLIQKNTKFSFLHNHPVIGHRRKSVLL